MKRRALPRITAPWPLVQPTLPINSWPGQTGSQVARREVLMTSAWDGASYPSYHDSHSFVVSLSGFSAKATLPSPRGSAENP